MGTVGEVGVVGVVVFGTVVGAVGVVVFGTPMHSPSIPFIVATILGTCCAAFDTRSCKLSSDLEGGAMNYF